MKYFFLLVFIFSFVTKHKQSVFCLFTRLLSLLSQVFARCSERAARRSQCWSVPRAPRTHRYAYPNDATYIIIIPYLKFKNISSLTVSWRLIFSFLSPVFCIRHVVVLKISKKVSFNIICILSFRVEWHVFLLLKFLSYLFNLMDFVEGCFEFGFIVFEM